MTLWHPPNLNAFNANNQLDEVEDEQLNKTFDNSEAHRVNNGLVANEAEDDWINLDEADGNKVSVQTKSFEPQKLSATSMNLAQAFVNLLQGGTVPSKMVIFNPETGEEEPQLKKELAQAAVKVATALMTSAASNRPISMGFQVGDFTVELTRSPAGKFTVEVEGMSFTNDQGENTGSVSEVSIEDVDAAFARNITNDVVEDLAREDHLYTQASKNDPFGALQQLLVASDEGGKSPLPRELFTAVLKARYETDKKPLNVDFDRIGLGALRHLTAQSVLNPQLKADNVRAELQRLSELPPLMVNSPEAARDLANIQALLEKNPLDVTSKVSIDNIGKVRTDPQQGMSETQKAIHSLVADLFMPEDTAIFDNTEGQAGKRMQQILLKHPAALKLMLEQAQQQGTLPFDTLPAGIQKPFKDFFTKLCLTLSNNYTGGLTEDEHKAFGLAQQNNQLNLDAERVKTALLQIDINELAELDKVVNQAADVLAAQQQQLITDKFNASLLKNAQVKAEQANNKPFYEVDIKAIYEKHVKTPAPTAEEKAQDPQQAKIKNTQHLKEVAMAMKEIWTVYKKPVLAIFELESKYELPLKQQYPLINDMYSTLRTLKDFTPNLPMELKNWYSPEGEEVFDRVMEHIQNNLDDEKFVGYFDLIDDRMLHLFAPAKDGNMNVLQESLINFTADEALKEAGIDLNSKTLAEMANEPDDFDKPGMGQLIKNVLQSYFVSASGNENLQQARETDKRSMISSMIRYSDNNATASTQLGAMLKGAGPLMHKLLQGLEFPGMDEDFKTALDDMKSNLNPIDRTYVQSQMLKLVDDSKGAITNIAIKQPLGAASVGQAFLVTVTPREGEPYEAVLKVIRPDVKVKAQREFEQFMAEASKIPGMADTYRGIYAQYQKEFDLRLEEDNIKQGQRVYNDNIDSDRVSTMSLVEGAPVSETSMLIKQAPGTTLDRYIKQTKAKIEEILTRPYKTHAEVLAIKKELKAVYEELHDINKSLGATAKKWLNKALFAKEGFFHGDMHPGNLMVKPGDMSIQDKTDPNSKSMITIIDYGNASSFDENQTQAMVKVNMAVAFGGLYQFDATEEKDKTNVERNTVKLFMEGFKALLSDEELAKFQSRETELLDNVIKPILLKGSKNELGIRLSLLIKKLQEAGVAIPGAIINMAESQKRLSNGLDELNALMDSIEDAFNNVKLNNIRRGMDWSAGLIDQSYDDKPITQEKIDEYHKYLTYDLNNRAPVDSWNEQSKLKLPENASADEIKSFNSAKDQAEKDYKVYVEAEQEQMGVLRLVNDCFGYSEQELWDGREIELDFTDSKHLNKIQNMGLGNYLKADKNADELLPLHREFLTLKAKLSEEVQKQLDGCITSLNSAHLEKDRQAARQLFDELSQRPEVREYLQCANKIKEIMISRMVETARDYMENMPLGNPAKHDPELSNNKNMASACVEIVEDKISADNEITAALNASNFASNHLNIGRWALLTNSGGVKSYLLFVANKF
ncbi:MAG: hypothetical protein IJ228_08160 [Succinivibrio sp.]|nr:hypothetical protein [Succinivibrio sp.]